MSYQIEACVINLEQAIRAESLGARRVELCICLETEGMTPDFSLAESVCNSLQIPVRIMIRETNSGFEADKDDLQKMIQSLKDLKSLKPNGFVFGVLRDHEIDQDAMEILLQYAFPLPVTFHKAIDLVDDLENEIAWINTHPQIDTILTSGGAAKAIDGIDMIQLIKKLFKGNTMVGGAIRPGDLEALHSKINAPWYHGKAIV